MRKSPLRKHNIRRTRSGNVPAGAGSANTQTPDAGTGGNPPTDGDPNPNDHLDEDGHSSQEPSPHDKDDHSSEGSDSSDSEDERVVIRGKDWGSLEELAVLHK